MNLLIVDDEKEILEGIQVGIHWQTLGFQNVFFCSSSQEAIKYFEQYTFDILLCDIEMPFMNGLQLLKWIREHNFDTECIFLTCHIEFDYARQALQLQSADYILKPISYNELTDILQKTKMKAEEKQLLKEYAYHGQEKIQTLLDKTAPTVSHGTELFSEIKKYIQEHLTEDLTAERISKAVYISQDYLFKLFKKNQNMTLVEYITQERMFCAKELLKNPEISVGQVAMLTGYNNYCYFIKVFKKNFGQTPSEYRRSCLKHSQES